ncbi:MAG: hypothetical protein LBT59_29875 [Clostridiales bacterium]|nr:hypothetical protein [Clostridiales bacterium]
MYMFAPVGARSDADKALVLKFHFMAKSNNYLLIPPWNLTPFACLHPVGALTCFACWKAASLGLGKASIDIVALQDYTRANSGILGYALALPNKISKTLAFL